MASIRKRGSSWQVQVRRTGFPLITKTFTSRADALVWARDKERKIDWGEQPIPKRELQALTVRSLLDRYEDEITPTKRGADRERYKLRVLRAHSLADARLDKVSGAMIAAYRDERLKMVTSGTVRRELAILRHCFEVARREWDIPLKVNPVQQIKLPAPSKARERRLTPGEASAFWKSVDRARAPWLKPFIVLAIETGMRRGELLWVLWQDVDLAKCLVRLTKTKNGHERVVPLTPLAVATLRSLSQVGDRVFPVKAATVRQAWERLIARAQIEDLRLHDLRHEAVSRFFEMGLSTPEVALISGHRDPRMLFRYTHLRPESVAQKLASLMNSRETKGTSKP